MQCILHQLPSRQLVSLRFRRCMFAVLLSYVAHTTFDLVLFILGYGDLYPVTNAQRVWGAIFVFLGITILGGIALSIIFNRLINMYDAISKEMKSETYQYYLNIFNDKDANNSEMISIVKELAKVTFKTVPLLILLFLPALLIGYFEGWTFIESLYYYSITATTGKATIILLFNKTFFLKYG